MILYLSGILALLVGIIVLLYPKILNIAVGLYLVIIGIVQLVADFGLI